MELHHLFNRYYRLAKSSQEESDINKVWGYNVAHLHMTDLFKDIFVGFNLRIKNIWFEKGPCLTAF